MELREGKITDVSGKTLIDSIDGLSRDFVNPAQILVAKDEFVIYVSIITPGASKEIINVIKGHKL